MASHAVSQIAFCSGVRSEVPQEEGLNQDSETRTECKSDTATASNDAQASLSPLFSTPLCSSSILGVLCVEPRITSYALDRSFRYVSLADRRTAQTRRCCVPYLTAGVAANVPDELGRGVHRPFISAFTCTSLFPKVEVVQRSPVEWSVWRCLVLSFRLHMRRASAVGSPRPRSAG